MAEDKIVGVPSYASKLVAEFLGTFLLVFTVGCNVLAGQPTFGGLSIACVLMVSIYALGGISGANFNPAVTASLGFVKGFGGKGMGLSTVCVYIFAQILAGVMAAEWYSVFLWESFQLKPLKYGWMQAMACEMIYTFMLCFVVLNVAVAEKNKDDPNQYYGLAIGFVIVAGAYGAGPISGGCFNPAVAIGIDAGSAIWGNNGTGWSLVYMAAELIGALLATAMYKLVRPEDFGVHGSRLFSQCVCEFLGTFILVFTVGLNVLAGSPAGALSIGASLMCMIYAVGDISGAHFNPAVTVAVLLSRLDTIGLSRALKYIGSQILGAIFAAFTYMFIAKGETFYFGRRPVGGNAFWPQIAAAEILFTMVLCLVVLGVAVSKRTASKDMFGFAIGSCIIVGGCAAGAASGGVLNPAVSIGISTVNLTRNEGAGATLVRMLLYSLFQMIGGAIAALIVRVTHLPEIRDPGNYSSA